VSTTPIRVLLVEDDEADVVLTRRLLTRGEGPTFDIRAVDRLASALTALQEDTADVVLLDLSLPDAHGLETFARVHAAFPRLPVIVVTGLSDEAMAVRAVQEGAQDYLIKGRIAGEQLGRSIRYAIERQRADVALQEYRDHLEDLVGRRTTELSETNERLRREIEERVRAEQVLKETVTRLEAHDRIRTEFVSNVSHELRTPVAAMRYAAENLLRGVVGPLPERIRAYLTRTVDDVLDLSRIENKTFRLNRIKVPFARLVERSVSPLRVSAAAKHLTLTVAACDENRFVCGDPLRLERVLFNVVDNAIKFTPEGGAIELSVARHAERDGYVTLAVTDTGIGIAPEHVGRVSERYFRVGEHVTGTGLGLAISREIVEQHGGTLLVRSPPPGRTCGTQVSIEMPVAEAPLVLIADDDPAILRLLDGQLQTHGYRVARASNGAEALDRARSAGPEAMILDLIMPVMDGAETLTEIKVDHRLRRLPVIVLTGAELDRAKRELLESYGVPAVAKPWREKELLSCLEEAILGKGYLA
jgi:signal transduction histidine kinase